MLGTERQNKEWMRYLLPRRPLCLMEKKKINAVGTRQTVSAKLQIVPPQGFKFILLIYFFSFVFPNFKTPF